MEILLSANSLLLSVSTAFGIGFLVAWLRAEKKLAKYGESKIYKKKGE